MAEVVTRCRHICVKVFLAVLEKLVCHGLLLLRIHHRMLAEQARVYRGPLVLHTALLVVVGLLNWSAIILFYRHLICHDLVHRVARRFNEELVFPLELCGSLINT